jgi:hypothetical protein
VAESLSRFRKTMWDKMQRKVAAILSTSQLSNYKIDDFLHVLDSVYRFIAIGEAFSGCDSDHMRRSIKSQSKQYFENMHKARMEDLSIMLSNEHWHPCPVADDFELDQIKEFMPPAPTTRTGGSSDAHDADHIFAEHGALWQSVQSRRDGGGGIGRCQGAPRRTAGAGGANGGCSGGSATSAAASAAASASGQRTPRRARSATFSLRRASMWPSTLASTVQMMQILEPISYQVFVGLEQLYNFYLFAVHKFFIESVPVPSCFRRPVAAADQGAAERAAPGDLAAVTAKLDELGPYGKGLLPHLDESVAARLADANGLYGAAKRSVAFESLVVLAQATKRLQPRLTKLLAARPGADKKLKDFLSSSVAAPRRCAATAMSCCRRWCCRLSTCAGSSRTPTGPPPRASRRSPTRTSRATRRSIACLRCARRRCSSRAAFRAPSTRCSGGRRCRAAWTR